MKIVISILIACLILNLTYIGILEAAGNPIPPKKPGNSNPPPPSGNPGGSQKPAPAPGPKPGSAPDPSSTPKPSNQENQNKKTNTDTTVEELVINWQGDSLTAALKASAKEKKITFVYFYFNPEKELFPPNYDPRLKKCSVDQYIFTKIHAKNYKDKTGKICLIDLVNADFFADNKLPMNAIAVALDIYGNMLDKLALPLTPVKIINFLDAAERKFSNNTNDLNKRCDKALGLLQDADSPIVKDKDKKIQDAIKILAEISKNELKGYEVIKKARDKLTELNDKAIRECAEILKDYATWEKDLQDPKAVTPELEKVLDVYKGLPAEQSIKDDIKSIKEGKIPEWVTKEIDKDKQKAAEEPAAKDK